MYLPSPLFDTFYVARGSQKIRHKHVRVKDPIYSSDLLIIVAPKPADYVKAVDVLLGIKTEVPRESVGGQYHRIEEGGFHYDVVWIRKYDASSASIAVLVHELYHYVSDFMTRRGIPPHIRTEEAYAYLLQYVTDLAHRSLVRKCRKPKSK